MPLPQHPGSPLWAVGAGLAPSWCWRKWLCRAGLRAKSGAKSLLLSHFKPFPLGGTFFIFCNVKQGAQHQLLGLSCASTPYRACKIPLVQGMGGGGVS